MLIHIYLAYDPSDAAAAADFARQLALAFQPHELAFWKPHNMAPEAYRREAALYLEQAALFIALTSQNIEDTPDTRWAFEQARIEQRRRPALQIAVLPLRPATIPLRLMPFPLLLPVGETAEQHALPRDRQLQRAAQRAKLVLEAAPRSASAAETVTLPLILDDVKERLLAQTDRYNPSALLALMNRLVSDVRAKRAVLDLEDALVALQEKARLSSITMMEFETAMHPLRRDLEQLLMNLREEELVADWKAIFTQSYFHYAPPKKTAARAAPVPFFLPCDDIAVPETLNLPVGPREQEALEQIGLLSYEQKLDFRRSLLLCRDALAVLNPSKAYAHCEHVRNQIDPQSAQLYEYLLLTYLQKEGAGRIMHDAIHQGGKLLHHVSLYAGRMREYQRGGQCPSTTGAYNLEIAAEALSDAALEVYQSFPNDYIRHTGHHADGVPDNRALLQNILRQTFVVNRTVHPYEEFLEAAIIEYCGGGKYHWIEHVEVAGDYFRFLPWGGGDPEGAVAELLQTLEHIADTSAGKQVKQRATLREDVYYSLVAKRQTLRQQVDEDGRRQRPFTDLRESIVRFVNACVFGAHLFGDEDEDSRGQSFLRMSLEYLLPGLVQDSEGALTLGMRWFVLDEQGEVATHPDCIRYRFDARGIVEKILRDYSGRAGWLQVQPSLKQEVYLQYVRDTEEIFAQVRHGLQWSDFRRMDALDARRLLVACLRRYMICYKAYPEGPQAQDFLDRCLAELSGGGFLLWVFHDPVELANVPESMALGMDARTTLRDLHALSTRWSEEDLRSALAGHLLEKRLLPAYNSVKAGDESVRLALVRLMVEVLANYKLHPNQRCLELVWDELCGENKLSWLGIDNKSQWVVLHPIPGFDPLAVLHEISDHLVNTTGDRERFGRLALRQHIAAARHADQVRRYFHEISEFKHENRRPEREIAIDIIRKIKAIYHFYPNDAFLELPLQELSDKGRIRWHAQFLGVFPTRENHYENKFYHFNYRFERFDLKRLLQHQYYEMERVLREVGEG